MMTTKQQAEKQEAREHLLEWLNPGDTVYTVLRHVSSSGMSRCIDVYTIKNNEPLFLTYWTSKLLGYRINQDKGGLVVGGGGMDMGWHVVHGMSMALFNHEGDYDHKKATCLNQRWL
jgi:hypothetical protein